jgi:hypothetical protein
MTPQEIITEIQKQLTDLKYNEGEYCLIVYKTIGYKQEENKQVYRVYNSFVLFEQNISKCLDEISEEFGVDVDIWQFD